MKTTCPRCNGMSGTTRETNGEVFHNKEVEFICGSCRHLFTGVFTVARGVPAHAQAFGHGNGGTTETPKTILTDC